MERHTAVSDEEPHSAIYVSFSPQHICIHCLVLAMHQLAAVLTKLQLFHCLYVEKLLYLKGQHMERHTAVSDEEAHCAADVSSSPQRIFIHRLVLAVHQLADVREEGDQIIWILKPAKLLHK